MKFARSFILSFLIAAIVGYLYTFTELKTLPHLMQEGVSKLFESKSSGKSYPIAVYCLLFLSALAEILISFKINAAFVTQLRDKSLQRVLKIGGGLVGVIAGMTISFYQQNNRTEVNNGLVLSLLVALYIVAPIFIAWSLRLLKKEETDTKGSHIIRWVMRFGCIAIAAIAIWGILKEIV